jgi:hypothetical protein
MYNQWDNEIQVNEYFDDIEYHIKQQLIQARESIDICVAWITIKNFESIFQELKNKDIKIRLICNDDNKNYFYTNSVENIYKVKSSSGGLMHNKFCIIDDKVLITGSYNWSQNAHKHYENIRISKNEFPSILRYKNEFEDLIIASFSIHVGRCHCNSKTINFLINANDIEGRNNFYKSSVWSICLAHNHCTLLHDELIEEYGWYEEEDEPIDDKEIMLLEFERNRNIINNRMKKNNGFDIHAQANILIKNEHDVIEYGELEEYILNIYWKHIFFRNRINSEYYDDNDISKIIDWANGRTYY